VWDARGHVVAASEPIEGADAVDVAAADGDWVAAAPVGSDPASGIAVMRASGVAAPPLELPFAGVARGDRVAVVPSPPPGASGGLVLGTVLDPEDGVWRVDLPPGAAWSPGAPIVGGSGLVGMALPAARAGGAVAELDEPGENTAGAATAGSVGAFVPAARLRRVVPALIDSRPIGTAATPPAG
jgi:hypothetical protein